MKKVACGTFVKRQTKESGHSHFEGSWEELEMIIEQALDTDHFPGKNQYITKGYRDGVILVEIQPIYLPCFYSGIVNLTEDTKLVANYAPRRIEEAPFIRISAKGKKQMAKHASVVLYRHDVLEENNERETDAEWEIVCIKARTSEEEEPMDPYTMARNFLHLKGGTKGVFTAEQFAKSIVYWNNHCISQGKKSFLTRLRQWFRKKFQTESAK